MKPLYCCVCGSPDWMAVSPGTAPNATRFLDPSVAEIVPADEEATVAWCLDHWQDSWVPIPDRRPEDECEDTPGQIDWIQQRDAFARCESAAAILRCDPVVVQP